LDQNQIIGLQDMAQPSAESGNEFILDNRKLIIGFMLLIVICGAFFVVGFMEGKRQAVQARSERPSSGPAGTPSEAVARAVATAPAKNGPAEDRSVREQLDWYKTVQGGDSAKRAVAEPPKNAEAEPTQAEKVTRPAAGTQKPAAVPKASSGAATYTVQVGAFRQRHEAESKADALKTRGYTFVIESPAIPDGLFLVKVGNFSSRADAVAMERRLRKDGFSCFIKTN
jgi:cell division septation protein DedD